MFNDTIWGDALEESGRFQPVPYFHRMGAQKVCYKMGGDAPKQEETKAEKAYADVARQKLKYARETFGGATEKYMDDVRAQDEEPAYQRAAANAGNATKKAFGDATERLTSGGVDPNSGRFQKSLMSLSDAEAMSGADTGARAVTQQQDEYVAGARNISAMGRGESAEAARGLGDVAYLSHQKAQSDAQDAFYDDAFQRQATGTVAGMAARGLQEVPWGGDTPGSQIKDYKSDAFKNWASTQ